jgi:hypothetical protein
MLRLRRIVRRLACWWGWHTWDDLPIPDIGPLSRTIIEREGRQCHRCGLVQWQPWRGSGWADIDLAAHKRDIDRRHPPHPGG